MFKFKQVVFFISILLVLQDCSTKDKSDVDKSDVDTPLTRLLPSHPGTEQLQFGCGENLKKTLWVYEPSSQNTSEIMVSSLQGIVNKTFPQIWIKRSGIQDLLLEELEHEGWTLNHVQDPWDLLKRYQDVIKGSIVYDIRNEESLNAATSLSGIKESITVDKSLLEKTEEMGINKIIDVSSMSIEKIYNEYSQDLSRDILVEQRVAIKNLGIRDFAIQSNALTFYYPGKQDSRDKFIKEGRLPFVFGWGWDEFEWVGDVTESGGTVIPSDYAYNLSALRCLPISLKKVIPDEIESQSEKENIVSFIISDGDNISWLSNDFITDQFWMHPIRREIPLTWEVTPSLALLAPRILKYFYNGAQTKIGEDFISSSSGPGYSFINRFPESAFYAERTAKFMKSADLSIISTMSDGGGFDSVKDLLAQDQIDAVFYKDFHPYHLKEGKIEFVGRKPIVAFRSILMEKIGEVPKEDLARVTTPEGLLDMIKSMPANPKHDLKSFALVSIHAWSWTDQGGPLTKLQDIVSKLPSKTRIVPASEFVRLLVKYHAPSS